MENVLRHLQWQTCLVYLDDIIVFSRDFPEHLHRLGQVFDRIKAAGLKLKPSKYHLFQKQVAFLGHIVSDEGLTTDPAKIEAVVRWPPPKNVSQVRSYLGFCSYYRRFIPSFSVIASPLFNLTRKGVAFDWNQTCQQAFEELKRCLTTAPIMAYPTDTGEFLLDTDASDTAIGAVLSQQQNEILKTIAYASRSLTKCERRYCVTRKELLTIVNFTQHFWHYLLGRKFRVRSDHQPLRWLFKLRDPSGQVARWLEILSAYDFTVDYRQGKKHNNADGLSRIPCDPRACECPSDDDSYLPCGPCPKCHRSTDKMSGLVCRVTTRSDTCKPSSSPSEDKTTDFPGNIITSKAENQTKPAEEPVQGIQGYSRAELQRLQQDDPDIRPIMLWKTESPQRPMGDLLLKHSPATRNLWLCWELLVIKDGLLYRKSPTEGVECLVLPQKLQPEVINVSHGSLLGGHLGQKKTLGRLVKKFYWFQMKDTVKNWVQKCITCSSNTRAHKKAKGPLGKMYVIQDYFTKWVEVFAVPDATAETCARAILDGFVSRFGVPLQLHSDQGRNFESDLMYELCSLLGMKKTRTSARHPSGNGMVERFNQTLIKMIKAFIDGKQNNWDMYLGCLAGAYRSSIHESTNYTPNMLMLGREVRMPASILVGENCGGSSSYGEFVNTLQENIWQAHQLARKFLGKNIERQEENYNTRITLNTYQPGDVVWALNEVRIPGRCPKLQNMWAGPFVVVQKFSDLTYGVIVSARGKKRILHHDKLQRFHGEDVPRWIAKVTQNLKDKEKDCIPVE